MEVHRGELRNIIFKTRGAYVHLKFYNVNLHLETPLLKTHTKYSFILNKILIVSETIKKGIINDFG